MTTPDASRVLRTGLSRRGFLATSLAVGAAGTLAACGGGSSNVPGQQPTGPASGDGGAEGYDGPKVDLAFWNGFTGGDGPVMKKLVDQFNTEHENIAVKMTTMVWEDYYTKLPSAVTAGKGPEIAIMHADSVATNAARQVIQPLDDVAASLNMTEADFAPVPWNAGLYQDIRYSIPLDVHPLGFYYNKTVLEQAGLDPEAPPTNREEYESSLDTMKSKGIQGYWITPFEFTSRQTVQSLTWQFGGTMISDDGGQVLWNEDPAVQALTWYTDMIKNGHSPDKQGQDADALALQNNKTAYNWNGIWNINTLKEKKDLQWGVSALPTIGNEPAVWAGSHQFVLPAQKQMDENKQTAARVFLNWISQQSIGWAEGGQVPARNEVRESPEFAALTEAATLGQQIDVVRFAPTIPGVGDVMSEFTKAINEAVLGKSEPAKALADSAARATKILEQNQKKYG